MSSKNDGGATGLQFPHHAMQLNTGRHIQSSGWLVQKYRLWTVCYRQCERQTTLLSGGEFKELGIPFFSQTQPPQQVEAGRHVVIGTEEFHGFVRCDAFR